MRRPDRRAAPASWPAARAAVRGSGQSPSRTRGSAVAGRGISIGIGDRTLPFPGKMRSNHARFCFLPRAEPAEDVTALVPDGPPRRFCWRGVTYEVAGAEGPERIAAEWWRAPLIRSFPRKRESRTKMSGEPPYTRLLSRRGRSRPPLLAFPRRALRARDGGGALVRAWAVCVSSSHEKQMTAYAELAVTTNFSFLRGASHPQELVATADELGLAAIGIADRNSFAGVVRAYGEARKTQHQAYRRHAACHRRWFRGAGLSDRSRSLRPALPPAHRRQSQSQERRMPSDLRRAFSPPAKGRC